MLGPQRPLAAAAPFAMTGDLGPRVADDDPALAGANRHRGADPPPGHAGAAGVERDAAARLRIPTAHSDCTTRVRSRIGRNGGRPDSGRSAAASSRANRSSGASPVVPWTRTSATSRLPRARCAALAAQLPNRGPAIALRFTCPTPRASLPARHRARSDGAFDGSLRARQGAQARGRTPQSRANARNRPLNVTARAAASCRVASALAVTPPKWRNALWIPSSQAHWRSCRNARTERRREHPGVATNRYTRPLSPATGVRSAPKST